MTVAIPRPSRNAVSAFILPPYTWLVTTGWPSAMDTPTAYAASGRSSVAERPAPTSMPTAVLTSRVSTGVRSARMGAIADT